MADQPESARKRRVKNPETFRERAVKAATESDKPSRTRHARRVAAGMTGPIARPFKRVFGANIFHSGPFRLVGKVLRFIGKLIWPVYLRNSFGELKFVTWPNWRQSRRLTYAVLGFAVVFGAAIAGLDWVLGKIFKAILLK